MPLLVVGTLSSFEFVTFLRGEYSYVIQYGFSRSTSGLKLSQK